MAIKSYKPTSPSRRHYTSVSRKGLWKKGPLKELTEGISSTGGRNNRGVITSRHQGGGHKKKYRQIDFLRSKKDITGTVERIEYDPNRSAHIALICYDDSEYRYILAPQKLQVGDKVIAGDKVDIKPGNSMSLKNIPVGTIVHNVSFKIGKKGQLARSAGTYVQLVGRDEGYGILKLPSGELRKISLNCQATIGAVSNADHQNISLGKAGRNRWLGVRPQTRGIAMNPVDHPHGGRTDGGRHPATPWGKPTKGKKTRSNKRTSKYIIRRSK